VISRLGNKSVLDIKEKRMFSEQIKIIDKGKEHFKKIIQMRKDEWIEEYQYWLDKSWL